MPTSRGGEVGYSDTDIAIPPPLPKKSPIMFGAALAGPLAAPSPCCANRSGVAPSSVVPAGPGAALAAPVPGWVSAPGWAAPADGVAPVEGAVGQGTQGWHCRQKICAKPTCGEATSSPAASVITANRPNLRRARQISLIFPLPGMSLIGHVKVATASYRGKETQLAGGFLGTNRSGLACFYRLTQIIRSIAFIRNYRFDRDRGAGVDGANGAWLRPGRRRVQAVRPSAVSHAYWHLYAALEFRL